MHLRVSPGVGDEGVGPIWKERLRSGRLGSGPEPSAELQSTGVITKRMGKHIPVRFAAFCWCLRRAARQQNGPHKSPAACGNGEVVHQHRKKLHIVLSF